MDIGHRFRVSFRTDASDDYFFRENEPGEFKLFRSDVEYHDYDIFAHNGVVNCYVRVPNDVQVGDVVQWEVVVSDITRIEPFSLSFRRRAVKHDVHPGGPHSRKHPIEEGDGNGTGHDFSRVPAIQKIRRDQWNEVEFDKFSALSVKPSPEGSLDFLINMDNAFLASEIRKNPKKSSLLEKQFEGALILFCLAVRAKFKEQSGNDDHEGSLRSLDDAVRESSSWFAVVVLPIIQAFANLEDLVDEQVESTGDDAGESP